MISIFKPVLIEKEPLSIDELQSIIVCQKIKDEIDQLEKDRGNWNLFSYSTEEKINIFNRLLQLMSVPEEFSDEVKDYFFEKNESITLQTLIEKLIHHKQFCDNNQSGSPEVENQVILNSPTSIFERETESNAFLDKLILDYPNLVIQSKNSLKKDKPLLPDKKIPIDELVVFGDSLTDVNLMRLSAVGNYSGLKGNSPKGSFTNGYTWLGHINTDLFNAAIIPAVREHLIRKKKSNADEDVIQYIQMKKEKINKLFKLQTEDQCNIFSINGKVVTRSYAIGGATAYSYRGMPSKSLTRYFTRLMVATLADQRKKFLADQANESAKAKAGKLIIEWIGANDLITVNEVPSLLEADNAIKARMEHLEELIKNGYTNFVLCNLPDLSLTPRYYDKSASEKLNAQVCTEYFNRQLEMRVAELKKLYPHCNINVGDVNSKFKACIEAIQNGGEEAKKYKKYINKEYKLKSIDYAPEQINRNDLYVTFDDHYNLVYHVIDPCGQRRSATITFDALMKSYDNLLDDDWKRILISEEIAAWKSGESINKDSELRKCILAITSETGDTIDEKDIFKPLKDTKAFNRFQQELAERNPSQTIEDLGYLPGVNRLFFDDVHPSADMHAFLYEEIKQFIGNKYQMTAPAVDLSEKNQNHDHHSKDDFNIPSKDNQPRDTKPLTGITAGKKWTEAELVEIFLRHYLHQFNQERDRFFGSYRHREFKWNVANAITLEEILEHARCPSVGSGARTREVLDQLGWIDKDGFPSKVLIQAFDYNDDTLLDILSNIYKKNNIHNTNIKNG